VQPVLWDLYAAGYDLIAGLAPYQDMLDEIVGALDVRPGMRILDAGCGTGALTVRLAQRHPDLEIVAVDASSAMLKRAKRRAPSKATFHQADINDYLAAHAGEFDRIVSVNLLWALDDPATTIGLMAGGLRPGGHMVHTTPRWRFRFDRIVALHLRRARGLALLRALAALPLLALAGLLNLVLVLQVLARHQTWRDRSRWQAQGLARLFSRPDLTSFAPRPTYAQQGFLVTCTKIPDRR
jgi:2-polyprenyl-3-methyl-5-hydroxy-6-metoxy-1,4-benzoquinol methylase